MPCSGDSAETCGGSYGMNIYSYNPVSSSSTLQTGSSSTQVSSVSTSVISTRSTSLSTSAPTGTPNSFTSIGCWTDNDVTERTLVGGAYSDQALTLSTCSALCKGFDYFGVEYSTECYCGNNFSSTSALATDERCNMPCKGDPTQICGGPYGMNIYKVLGLSSSSSSIISTTASSQSSSSASRTSSSSTKSTTPTPSIPARINE